MELDAFEGAVACGAFASRDNLDNDSATGRDAAGFEAADIWVKNVWHVRRVKSINIINSLIAAQECSPQDFNEKMINDENLPHN